MAYLGLGVVSGSVRVVLLLLRALQPRQSVTLGALLCYPCSPFYAVTIGALFPRGGPDQDPVLTTRVLEGASFLRNVVHMSTFEGAHTCEKHYTS